MLFQEVLLQTENVLSLVIADQIHGLQSGNDILLLDACLLAEFVDGDLWSLSLF